VQVTIDSIISEFPPPGKLEEGLPKYRLKYGTRRLNEALTKLGMVVAFDGEKANFRSIAKVEPQNLFISFTYYKAVVEVNEVWTEAAAVTNVGIGITAMPVYDARAGLSRNSVLNGINSPLRIRGQIGAPSTPRINLS